MSKKRSPETLEAEARAYRPVVVETQRRVVDAMLETYLSLEEAVLVLGLAAVEVATLPTLFAPGGSHR